MAAFEYIALNQRGREEKGVLEADSSRQVRQMLRDRGLAPLSVEVTSNNSAGRDGLLSQWFTPSLSVSERALITRQLATLIAAALPVEEALLAVSKQNDNARAHKILVSVRARVMEGYSLAGSLADFPRAFPDLFRATVASGESSGHLDLVLDKLADFTESQQAARSRMIQAMIYPAVLFVLTIAILAGLLGYVVPDIVDVFAETGQELPVLTVAVIATSEFIANWGIVILLALVGLSIGAQRLLKIPAVRLGFDRRLLHLPLVAKISRGINTSQFASTLSILSTSGVPLVEAMKIAGEVVSNTWLKAKVEEATVRVSEGSSLNAALDHSGYFPPMMLHMIASGEASGELDKMLERVARQTQQDVEVIMGIILSLFGPMMLIVMGGAVFIIVMAILLPIINLNQLVV